MRSLPLPLHIRPLGPADRERIEAGFRELSQATVTARFLSWVKPSPSLFAWVDQLDGRDSVAIGASHAASGSPLGVARYVRFANDPSRADLAVTVVDAWQRRGVGTALLVELARHAADAGIATFSATAFAENRGAQRLAATLGPLRFGPIQAGVVTFDVPVPVVAEGARTLAA